MDDFYKWMEQNPVLAIGIGTALVLLIYYYYGSGKKTSTSGSSDSATSGLSSYYAAETASTNANADASIASINAGRDVDLAKTYSNRDVALGDQTTTRAKDAQSSDLALQDNKNFYGYWDNRAGEVASFEKQDNTSFWDYWINNQQGHQINSLALETGADATGASLIARSSPSPSRNTFH